LSGARPDYRNALRTHRKISLPRSAQKANLAQAHGFFLKKLFMGLTDAPEQALANIRWYVHYFRQFVNNALGVKLKERLQLASRW
jgi:hypothetical protein